LRLFYKVLSELHLAIAIARHSQPQFITSIQELTPIKVLNVVRLVCGAHG
jgi:hypothetical protein